MCRIEAKKSLPTRESHISHRLVPGLQNYPSLRKAIDPQSAQIKAPLVGDRSPQYSFLSRAVYPREPYTSSARLWSRAFQCRLQFQSFCRHVCLARDIFSRSSYAFTFISDWAVHALSHSTRTVCLSCPMAGLSRYETSIII